MNEHYFINSDRPAPLVSPEHEAVLAGVRGGDAALDWARRFAVFKLFMRVEQLPNADPKLEMLRAYAELKRALSPQGYIVPATSLSAAGFTASQIAGFDAIIASA